MSTVANKGPDALEGGEPDDPVGMGMVPDLARGDRIALGFFVADRLLGNATVPGPLHHTALSPAP